MIDGRDPARIAADRRFIHLVLALSIFFSAGAALAGRLHAAAEPYTVGVGVDEAGLGLLDEAESYGSAVWRLHRRVEGPGAAPRGADPVGGRSR